MKNIKKYKEFISENKVGDYMIPDYTIKDYTKKSDIKDTKFRIFYQHGIEDEGIIEIGIVYGKNEKDAIKEAVDEYTNDEKEREYFYKFAKAQEIK